jgi:hypothetical protein
VSTLGLANRAEPHSIDLLGKYGREWFSTTGMLKGKAHAPTLMLGWEYVEGKWGDEWSRFRTCQVCANIRKDFFQCGFHYGGLRVELAECYGIELT